MLCATVFFPFHKILLTSWLTSGDP